MVAKVDKIYAICARKEVQATPGSNRKGQLRK